MDKQAYLDGYLYKEAQDALAPQMAQGLDAVDRERVHHKYSRPGLYHTARKQFDLDPSRLSPQDRSLITSYEAGLSGSPSPLPERLQLQQKSNPSYLNQVDRQRISTYNDQMQGYKDFMAKHRAYQDYRKRAYPGQNTGSKSAIAAKPAAATPAPVAPKSIELAPQNAVTYNRRTL